MGHTFGRFHRLNREFILSADALATDLRYISRKFSEEIYDKNSFDIRFDLGRDRRLPNVDIDVVRWERVHRFRQRYVVGLRDDDHRIVVGLLWHQVIP
jgi:hypothetical protein